MLLERLGPNLAELGLNVGQILEAVTTTLRSFWRPITAHDGLRTGDEQARWLARYIGETWDELGQPCERPVIDHTLMLCERRAAAFDPTRSVLVHGDAHGWNTLAAGRGTYKFVDAEGLCSEPEHDLGVAMREYDDPLLDGDTPRLVQDRAAFLADRCAVDTQAVWEWGFIERCRPGWRACVTSTTTAASSSSRSPDAASDQSGPVSPRPVIGGILVDDLVRLPVDPVELVLRQVAGLALFLRSEDLALTA